MLNAPLVFKESTLTSEQSIPRYLKSFARTVPLIPSLYDGNFSEKRIATVAGFIFFENLFIAALFDLAVEPDVLLKRAIIFERRLR